MPITEPIYPWPTLTEFLDAGGDLWSLHPPKDFMDELYGGDAALKNDADRSREAELLREMLAEWWTGDPTHNRTPAEHFDHCRRISWEADMLTDPALADRVRASLPPEERAKGEQEFDVWLRPHPLTIGVPGRSNLAGWNCDGCGKRSSWETEAICIGEREGHSDLPYDISYCRECIAVALEAYDIV